MYIYNTRGAHTFLPKREKKSCALLNVFFLSGMQKNIYIFAMRSNRRAPTKDFILFIYFFLFFIFACLYKNNIFSLNLQPRYKFFFKKAIS